VTRAVETQVPIVGAGPAGVALALDLASRGIDVLLVEQRRPAAPLDVIDLLRGATMADGLAARRWTLPRQAPSSPLRDDLDGTGGTATRSS
jgi:glycine/D-amino acid oxidase-like deaminating enzyme